MITPTNLAQRSPSKTTRDGGSLSHRRLARWCVILSVLTLAGCTTTSPVVQEPLREPRPDLEREEELLRAGEVPREEPLQEAQFRRISSPLQWRATTDALQERYPEELPEGPFELVIEGMPLRVFIDELFGRQLELSYRMDEGVREAEDLVTLRLSGPRSGKELYGVGLEVLASFGVAVFERNEIYQFRLDPDITGDQPPLLVSGRALPDVPVSHRPIFQFVPLTAVTNSHVRNWLQQIYQGQDLTVTEDPIRNAIILRGPSRIVRQALEAIEVLDQPFMRGRQVLRIDPAFREAGDLASDLVQTLSGQGYQVTERPGSTGAIVVMPISSINSIFVFAASDQILLQAQHWARELDEASVAAEESGIFRYSALNTSAESIAGVLQRLISGGSLLDRPAEGERDQREGRSAPPSAGGLVVDEARNAILFQGTGEQWRRLRPLMAEMDVPPRSVLVEVTIAEITLTEEYSSGIEWALRNVRIGGVSGPLGTEDALGLGARGISWFPVNSSGSARAALQAFAGSDRVSILSTPRILVRSGEDASISVGTDIPVITSTATRPDLVEGGTSSILQSVAFRKTGVLLNVRPIVHAGNRVDLAVAQEVSEARQTDTSGIDSPTILERSIQTSLTLRDGGSVMLGGLMTDSSGAGENRVPGLGRIPLLGRLFRTESRSGERTELIVMITPYILDDHEEAEELTRLLRARLAPAHPAAAGGGNEFMLD